MNGILGSVMPKRDEVDGPGEPPPEAAAAIELPPLLPPPPDADGPTGWPMYKFFSMMTPAMGALTVVHSMASLACRKADSASSTPSTAASYFVWTSSSLSFVVATPLSVILFI